MIIGVDVGALAITDDRLKVGVYRVALNLLRELSQLDIQNIYRLYSFQPIAQEVMRAFGKNMKNVVLQPKAGWFTARLPLELMIHPVDIFLGLSQAIPQFAPKSIGFLYDVGFIHAPENYPGSYKKLSRQTDALLARSTILIAISQTTANDVVEHYPLAKDTLFVGYPGVEKRFSPRGEQMNRGIPYFLFVGSLKRQKNIPFLIRAFGQFLKTNKKQYDLLLIGGDYWLDPEILKVIEDLHLTPCVHRLGFVSDDALPAYYRGATAFVSPSLWEGFCLPAVEAMACGCPVIGSTSGAFSEIVGDAGFLIDPYNMGAMAEAMRVVTVDNATRKKHIVMGITRAKQFSWNQFAQTTLRCIETIE